MTDYFNMALAGWREFQDWSPSTFVLYPMLALSLICAVIVSMFTAASRMFTIPIGFIVLVFAANLSNFLGRNMFLSGVTDLQKTMIFTILGNCIAAFIVLAFFKVSERR
jgi:hypothetical protein